MAKLIITNNSDIQLPESRVITVEDFIAQASSDEGIDLRPGEDFYCDLNNLDEDIYHAIKSAMPSAIFFTYKGISVPHYAEGTDYKNIYPDQKEVSVVHNDINEPTSMINPNVEMSNSFGSNNNSSNNISGDSVFDVNDLNDGNQDERITSLLRSSVSNNRIDEYDSKEALVYLFGSSKGGTGKTFTCLISAYRYAKTHPDQKVALADFDIIDGQVAISIHKIGPTMYEYFKDWRMGDTSFRTMKDYKVNTNRFPENLDFYLAPKDMLIKSNEFWENICSNLIKNYDVVFFDSGIDYLNYEPISTLYKIADKIIIISTTSIKSVSSVSKQIRKLKGEIENNVFDKEDELADKINIVITQASKNDEMNSTVFKTLEQNAKISGVFGVLTSDIQRAEYFGMWNVFDNNKKFNETIDNILKI